MIDHYLLCTAVQTWRAGIAQSILSTGYGLDGRDSIPGRDKRFISTPQRPDRLWGPPSLLPQRLWKTRGSLNQNTRCPGSNSNRTPLKYKSSAFQLKHLFRNNFPAQLKFCVLHEIISLYTNCGEISNKGGVGRHDCAC
jgi:hypothetical protein